MTDPIRLSKRLIELVGCSRREAELFIEGGWVSVDGEVIDEPQFKVTTQKVELDPDAKATVRELLHDLGWSDQDILDLGGVETAVGTEHAFHLFFGVLTALQSPQFTLSVAR